MTLYVFRHPKARGAAGRCIGHTDLPVDPRKAKNLAHRIRTLQRRAGLPRAVCTSDLQRAAAVGRWLRRWGWVHRVDGGLSELDFGAWDGCDWTQIPQTEVDAWCADFLHGRPGGGECLAELLARVAAWQGAGLVVSHGGWLSARRWLAEQGGAPPHSAVWPAPPRHGQLTCFS